MDNYFPLINSYISLIIVKMYLLLRDKNVLPSYIALLRGINVSGQKMIKMTDLKVLFQKLGFTNIQTYLQSGNVVFKSNDLNINALQTQIQQGIQDAYGFDVPTLILTSEELNTIITHNPFLSLPEMDSAFFHVTFLENKPATIDFENIISKKNEREQIDLVSNAFYLYCPDGYGKTKLHNSFLEKQVKVTATTRNWKTCLQLVEMTQNI